MQGEAIVSHARRARVNQKRAQRTPGVYDPWSSFAYRGKTLLIVLKRYFQRTSWQKVVQQRLDPIQAGRLSSRRG